MVNGIDSLPALILTSKWTTQKLIELVPEISGDNSGGLFDNYCITSSLDATEDNIVWENIDPDDWAKHNSEKSECESILEITKELMPLKCLF